MAWKYGLFIFEVNFYTIPNSEFCTLHFLSMEFLLNKGLYCLIIKLLQTYDIKIGCLGTFSFPVGFYVYAGSAQNNLERRIERHLQREKKLHWHIDYLLHYGQVVCVNTYAGEKNEECKLNRKIGNIKNATVLVKGFGSSDCSCISHLHFFQDNPGIKAFEFQNKVSTANFFKRRGIWLLKHPWCVNTTR